MTFLKIERSLFSYITICFLIALLFSACGATKKSQKEPINQPKIVEKPKIENTKPKLETPTIKPPPDMTKAEKPREAQSSSFKVAVMLPLHAYNVVYNDTLGHNIIPDETLRALEYYEGVLVALDRLRESNYSFDVHVFDTENTSYKIDMILADPDVAMADLIIGPFYNQNVRKVADFAKQRGINIVSPVSPSDRLVTNNPYFMQINPRAETHSAAIYEYIANTAGAQEILIISQDVTPEISLANKIINISQNTSTREGFRPMINHLIFSPDMSNAELTTFLRKDMPNYIIVTSFNEPFVNQILSRLNSLRRTYPIQLFGMPNWKRFQTMSLGTASRLNLHLSTDFWRDKTDPNDQYFVNAFFNKMNSVPSDFARKGYDAMLFFGDQLKKRGRAFPNYFHESDIEGIYTNFDFRPTNIRGFNNFSVDLYENKYVHILELVNYEYIKVND